MEEYINLRTELLNHINYDNKIIIAAQVHIEILPEEEKGVIIELDANLKYNYLQKDYEEWLERFNLKDLIFGNSIIGTIWYADGTWSERYEIMSGYECWKHYKCPSIPDELK